MLKITFLFVSLKIFYMGFLLHLNFKLKTFLFINVVCWIKANTKLFLHELDVAPTNLPQTRLQTGNHWTIWKPLQTAKVGGNWSKVVFKFGEIKRNVFVVQEPDGENKFWCLCLYEN